MNIGQSMYVYYSICILYVNGYIVNNNDNITDYTYVRDLRRLGDP